MRTPNEHRTPVVTAVADSARSGGVGEHAAAVVTVENRLLDPATVLHRLRTAFPHYAFLHDPHTGTWTALRGRAVGGVTIVKRDPLALRIAVTEAEDRRSR